MPTPVSAPTVVVMTKKTERIRNASLSHSASPLRSPRRSRRATSGMPPTAMRVVDDDVEDRDDRDEHPVVEEVEMEDGQVHDSP